MQAHSFVINAMLPCADKFQQIGRHLRVQVCIPGNRRQRIAIAPAHRDRYHASRAPGLDITQIVANVPAMAGFNANSMSRLEQWRGMGFCEGRGIA